MPFNDDKFGPIWPTREGKALGGARERQMLEAIGGSEGFRTRYSYNPDGSITEMRTKNGMPQFITTAAKKVADIVAGAFSSAFYATPTSLSYPNGYMAPTGTPTPVGPHHEWLNFHTLPTQLPAAFPAAEPVLAPRYVKGDTRGSGTWFGSVVIGGARLTIGWRNGNARNGNFAVSGWSSGSQVVSHYYECNSLPTNNMLLSLGTYAPRDKYIWIGRHLRIELPTLTIDSAALRQTASGYSLYVISGMNLYVSTGWEAVFGTDANGGTYVKRSIDATTLAMLQTFTLVGAINCPSPYSVWRVKQAMYFNHDGTKFVALATVDWYKACVFEFDVDTLSPIEKASSQSVSIDAIGTMSGGATIYDPMTANYQSGAGQRKKLLLAADYHSTTGDLVWLSAEIETRSGGFQISSSGVSLSGPHPGTVTMSGSGNGTFYGPKATVTIKHSLLGTIRTETIVDRSLIVEYTSSYADGGACAVDVNGTVLSGAYSATVTESVNSLLYLSGITASVQNGDIRSGTAVVDIAWTEQLASSYTTTSTKYQGPNPPASDSSSRTSSTTTLTQRKRRIFTAFGKYIKQQSCRVYELVSPNPSYSTATSSLSVPTGYSASTYVAPGAGAEHDDTASSNTIIPGNWTTTNDPNVLTAEPYTFVAVDPDMTVAYVGAQSSRLYLDMMDSESFLTFDSGSGVVSETAIPAGTYAPGSSSTLVNPVFYSKEPDV